MEQSIATYNLDFPSLWENSLYISLPTSITMKTASFDILNNYKFKLLYLLMNYAIELWYFEKPHFGGNFGIQKI